MTAVQREFRLRHAAARSPATAPLPWRERRTAEGCLVRSGDELVRLEGRMHWARHVELSCEIEARA